MNGTKTKSKGHTPIPALKCIVVEDGIFPVGFVLFFRKVQNWADFYDCLSQNDTRCYIEMLIVY